MCKKLFLLFIGLCSAWFSQAQSEGVPVFVSGSDGYESYRIPAIIQLSDGELLAFCEGRVNHMDDFGDIDIVLKRSGDQGKTWSSLQVVLDEGKTQLCNPAPVIDVTDPRYPQGRIFLFYNSGDCHEADILAGKGLKRSFYKTSADKGRTWSEAVEITSQIHLPNMPHLDPSYNHKEDWRYYANTPGHAIQLREGAHKGRIWIAANHSTGDPRPDASHYMAHGYYTDDHGQTFHRSADIGIPGSNESMATELSSGRLMMNSRNQKRDIRARIVSLSDDGGQTWDRVYFDRQLIDPVCQGSILSVGEADGKTILAFCNAADTLRRDNLTLRISFDEGKTWPASYPIYKGPDSKKDNAAYSDLVRLSDDEVGILFEKDGYAEITFVSKKWR